MKQASKVKILFLNSRSELGGADICLLEIIKNLDKQQFTAFVVLPEPGPLSDNLKNCGAIVIYNDLNPLERPKSFYDIFMYVVRFLPTLLQIVKLINHYKIDVVYTNSSAIQVGAAAAFLCRKVHIWHIREIWFSPRKLIAILYWYVYRFSHHIITITDAVRFHAFNTKVAKITTLYDGIDVARFSTKHEPGVEQEGKLTIPPNSKVIGVISRIIPWKGHMLLLEAVNKLLIDKCNIYLVVIGDIPRNIYQPYKEQLHQYVADHNMSNCVQFVGWQQKIPEWLQLFDILVVPSIEPEPLGVVIPEAWAAGVPVIASNHGGPAEIIQHNQNGLLFEPGNASALYEAIHILLNDPTLYSKLIKAGRNTVEMSFDAVKNTEVIQNIILSLIGRV